MPLRARWLELQAHQRSVFSVAMQAQPREGQHGSLQQAEGAAAWPDEEPSQPSSIIEEPPAVPPADVSAPPVPEGPTQPVEANTADAVDEWLLREMKQGDRFAKLKLMQGIVRHDIMIEKSRVGRLIGVGGSVFKALVARTGCEIFVLDKEGAPPGCAPHMRLVILMGSEVATGCAAAEIEDLMKR